MRLKPIFAGLLTIYSFQSFAQNHSLGIGMSAMMVETDYLHFLFPKYGMNNVHFEYQYEKADGILFGLRYTCNANITHIHTFGYEYLILHNRWDSSNIGKVVIRNDLKFADITIGKTWKWGGHRISGIAGPSMVISEDETLKDIVWVSTHYAVHLSPRLDTKRCAYFGLVARFGYSYSFFGDKFFIGVECIGRAYTQQFPNSFNYGINLGYRFVGNGS